MATEIQLRRSQWFYDDTGYYSYVLLNAPEDQFKKVQQILRSNGLRVLLAGKSYRPASNGVQYQWYIRVSDESGRHPTHERVNGIFATYEAVETKGVVPEVEFRKLADKVTAQGEEIRKLKAALSGKERQYQIAAQRLESVRKQNQELQAIYEKAQLELQEYRQRIHRLELRLRQIQETALKPEDVTQIRRDYEDTIQALRQELEDKEKELASWISNFEPEVQEREQEITALRNQLLDLQNQIAIVEGEKRHLIDQIQEIRAAREVEPEKENPEYLFRETLSILLPDIEFLGGSFDTLWREMQNPTSVLRDLTKLGQLKAKRVRRADEWLERHIGSEWRLYFRRCEDAKYQVLISHKNTQEADIDWLKRQ